MDKLNVITPNQCAAQKPDVPKVNIEQINTIINYINTSLVYKGFISQQGNDNPVVEIVKNNIGHTLEWTRTDVGTYSIVIPTEYDLNKVFPKFYPSGISYIEYNNSEPDIFEIIVYDSNGDPSDNVLSHYFELEFILKN